MSQVRRGALAMVILGIAVVACGTIGEGQPSGAAMPATTSSATHDATMLRWMVAKRESGDTELMVAYDGLCTRGFSNVQAVEAHDRVVVTVREEGIIRATCRTNSLIRVSLKVPLGTRQLIDGSDLTPRHSVDARDIPVPTYPADAVHGAEGALGEDGWLVHYTRPGGPDVVVRMSRSVADTSNGTRLGTTTIRGRPAVIWQRDGFDELVWEADGWGYRVWVLPTEGATVSISEVRRIAAGLR